MGIPYLTFRVKKRGEKKKPKLDLKLKEDNEKEEETEDASVIEDSPASYGYEVVAEGSKPPIVRVVDLVITEALTRRASDIHIEPEEETFLGE